MRSLLTGLIMALTFLGISGCASHPPLATTDYVDLDRFMGSWYVQGYTPILVDKEAHNAVEHYYPAQDGTIRTTYQFRKGAFDGDLKTFTPTGFIYNEATNAEWRMQFIWPFKAQYLIHYLSPDYGQTIIAHPNRKYAWIMSREPQMDETTYQALLDRLLDAGFSRADIQRVPHDWDTEPSRLEVVQSIGASRPLAEAYPAAQP